MILREERRGADRPVGPGEARLGRDPGCDIVFPEEDSVVSAVHARVYRGADGAWWLEDLGSTNGTWLDGRRLTTPARLGSGSRFTLGQRGPALLVVLPEAAGAPQPHQVLLDKPALRLRRVAGGQDLVARADEVILGRGADCTIPLRTIADTVVSKHHAVVEVAPDGSATIRDLGSKNGTFLNGQPVEAAAPLRVGDRVMLGWHGPLFEVRTLGPAQMDETEGAAYHPDQEPAKTVAGMVQVAEAEARGEHGVRAAVFVRALARQMATESSRSFRITVLALMVAILGSVGLVYREAARRTQEAAVRLETAERVLAEQIQSARAAQERSDAEIKSLRRELEQARRAAVSRLVLDSLERRLREAEARAARPQASGSAPALDLTRLAAENRRAVGLVLARFGADSTMGSGFAITRSGYFVTSRHVVRDPERADPQAIEVRMAETRTSLAADVVAVSSVESQDIAVLKIRNYRGDYVRSVDWDGVTVRQGAPAAIIGFPGGTQNALDPTGQVLTTMFSGIIAQVTTEWVKFGGTTFSGASGSPIFNADGAVVAVHYGGLREGPGLGFSVPIGRVRRWLPPAARSELGLP